jgi:hypothetical protein
VAEGDHRALGYAQPQRGSQVGARGRGAVLRLIADQDLADGGAWGGGVHDLGVFHLFPVGQPRRGGPGQAVDDLQLRRGQAEQVVEPGQILADVGDPGRRPGRYRELRSYQPDLSLLAAAAVARFGPSNRRPEYPTRRRCGTGFARTMRTGVCGRSADKVSMIADLPGGFRTVTGAIGALGPWPSG